VELQDILREAERPGAPASHGQVAALIRRYFSLNQHKTNQAPSLDRASLDRALATAQTPKRRFFGMGGR
jgi:hypothetical protein